MARFPFLIEFSMGGYQWYSPEDGPASPLEAEVALTDEDVRQLKDFVQKNGGERNAAKLGLDKAIPDVFKKMDEAAREVCDRVSYGNALIQEFEQNEAWYDGDPHQMMARMEADGLFEYDPENASVGEDDPDPKYSEYRIWYEEYFFSLPFDQMVAFIEKYYGYLAGRLTEEKMAYSYSVLIPDELS